MKYKSTPNKPTGFHPNAGSTGETGPLGKVTNGKCRDWKGPKPSGVGTYGPTNTPQSPNAPR